MAITTEDNRTDELTTDGVETDFDFDMHIHHESEVQVWYEPAGGRYNSLLLYTNYGVVFTDDGGTVSTDGYSAPLGAGKLLIIRHLEITQQTNWLYNDNHTGQQHQDDFDRTVMRDLQIQEQLDRCVGFAIHSSTRDITFPEPEANYLVGWNAAGDDLTNISPPEAGAAIPVVLNDLDDVVIAAPVNGDLLRYDGIKWTNDLAGAVTYTSITIAGNTLDTTEWSVLDGVTADMVIDWTNATENLLTTGSITGGSLIAKSIFGSMTITSNSITNDVGDISFGDETVSGTGALSFGSITGTSLITASDIGIAADTDLLQLAANHLTTNGYLTVNSGTVNAALSLTSTDSTVLIRMADDTTTPADPLAIARVGNDLRFFSGDDSVGAGTSILRLEISSAGDFDFKEGTAKIKRILAGGIAA